MRKKRDSNNVPGPTPLLVATAALCLWRIYMLVRDGRIQPVSYSNFINALAREQIKAVQVQGDMVTAQTIDGGSMQTMVPPTQEIWSVLDSRKTDVTIQPRSDRGRWIKDFIFPCVWLVLMLYMSGVLQMPHFSLHPEKEKKFTFADVAGNQESKEALKDIVDMIKNPETYTRVGAQIPRGVLLTGSPGSGKTLMARALAGEAQCSFIPASGSQFVHKWVGEGASRVRELFDKARRKAPCIVFIDELDAVGNRRHAASEVGEYSQTLNEILVQLDGFSTKPGQVIIIGATNRPQVLDPALTRPGRFDRIVEVGLPDLKDRAEILALHGRGIKLAEDVDFTAMARGTTGFSGAELRNVMNEAAIIAAKEQSKSVTMDFLEQARDKVMLGPERKMLLISPEEKFSTACHEAGHTLLTVLLPNADPLHKVTILPRGRALGGTWSLPEKDHQTQKKEQLIARIMICLGGMLAEQLCLGTQTTGCSDDLQKATKIARSMVTHLGMSTLGPMTFDVGTETTLRTVSELTARQVDKAVASIIRSAKEKAERILANHREDLDKLAKSLAEKETMSALEVHCLLGLPYHAIGSAKVSAPPL